MTKRGWTPATHMTCTLYHDTHSQRRSNGYSSPPDAAPLHSIPPVLGLSGTFILSGRPIPRSSIGLQLEPPSWNIWTSIWTATGDGCWRLGANRNGGYAWPGHRLRLRFVAYRHLLGPEIICLRIQDPASWAYCSPQPHAPPPEPPYLLPPVAG